MKLSAVVAVLFAGAALLPAAQARNITVQVDTPEFGIRIGPGGALHGSTTWHRLPIPAPVVLVPQPVLVVPVAKPVLVFMPGAGWVPAPAVHPHWRGHFGPPGHHRKHKRHWRHAERGYWRELRDDD